MIKKKDSGFTIVELVITIAIVTILSVIAILNYSTFNDRLAISSAGQEVAVAIRQAQTYGLNVKESAVGGGNFNSAYGISFNVGNDQNSYYVIFVDNNPTNKRYDVGDDCGGLSTECVEKIPLRNNVTITSFDSSVCGGANASRSLDITFLRPNPDADINFYNNGGNPVCSSVSNGQVNMTSNTGRTINVSVEKTGQISVQ